MKAVHLLRDLEARGIYLILRGAEIHALNPARLTPDDRSAIKTLRPALLALLRPSEPLDPGADALGVAYAEAVLRGTRMPGLAGLTRTEAAAALPPTRRLAKESA